MAYKFYFPLNMKPEDAKINTYEGHGCGKLDIPASHTETYAMCDGKIAGVGTYRDGTTYCALECTQSGLGITFYIRYLHGNYTVKAGQQVKRGDLLGYTDSIGGGSTGDHLHIDFSAVPNQFEPIYGQLDGTTFIYNNKKFPLIDEIDLDKVNNWYKSNGANDGRIGYCWLVMASKLEQVKN